ncbi:hypothetical protein M1506_01025 [Patescibacteria group bacterium]|nr:hypothetical protein [Patescibacteria group bacterium]
MRPEEKLRKKIKSILKVAQQPEERVVDQCGPVEFGLDLVMLKLDPFGQLRAFGMQIKVGNISCSKKKTNAKVKEIIGQLAVAFGKDVEVNGKAYRLDGFYVVTDGEINQFAREYISAACRGIRNLHFIDGQSLSEFFSKFGPKVSQFKET